MSQLETPFENELALEKAIRTNDRAIKQGGPCGLADYKRSYFTTEEHLELTLRPPAGFSLLREAPPFFGMQCVGRNCLRTAIPLLTTNLKPRTKKWTAK
jgi:hypothetical protein